MSAPVHSASPSLIAISSAPGAWSHGHADQEHDAGINGPRSLGLAAALAHPAPALVDLITDPHALSMPSHMTVDEARGFALAATKVVLVGSGGRTLDLARANVRNIPRPVVPLTHRSCSTRRDVATA